MFGGSKAAKPQTRIDSLIGAGTTLEGNVTFSGGLRIDGLVRGNVQGAADGGSTLVVSEAAVVEGEIRVAHVVVNGTVKGPIHAGQSLELQPKARITGDVFYDNIEIHLGAVVDGRLAHRVDSDAKAVELKLASNNPEAPKAAANS